MPYTGISFWPWHSLVNLRRGWGTHRGGDIDEKGVAVDAHSLQEGVASNLPLIPLPPGQETPYPNRHQPGIHEDDYCSYRHCWSKAGQRNRADWVKLSQTESASSEAARRTDLCGTVVCSGRQGLPSYWGRWTSSHWSLLRKPVSHRSRMDLHTHTRKQMYIIRHEGFQWLSYHTFQTALLHIHIFSTKCLLKVSNLTPA